MLEVISLAHPFVLLLMMILYRAVVDEAGENCLGAIFTMDESSSISWIFGE